MSVALDRQRILACLSDPSRFSLVTTLATGPRCVTDLAGLVGLSQSCTTRHLQTLLRAGIVAARREGKRVVYALEAASSPVQPLLEWVCALELGGAEAAAPRRTRRATTRPGRPTDELEPEQSAFHAAIEHESGWIGADAAADADLRQSGARPDAAERSPDSRSDVRPPPHRGDMDDFLL